MSERRAFDSRAANHVARQHQRDRRHAHDGAAAFAGVAGRLTDLHIGAQSGKAGQARRASGMQAAVGDQTGVGPGTTGWMPLSFQPAQERVVHRAWRMPDAAVDSTPVGVQNALCGKERHLRVVGDGADDAVVRWQIHQAIREPISDLAQRPELDLGTEAVADRAADQAGTEKLRAVIGQDRTSGTVAACGASRSTNAKDGSSGPIPVRPALPVTGSNTRNFSQLHTNVAEFKTWRACGPFISRARALSQATASRNTLRRVRMTGSICIASFLWPGPPGSFAGPGQPSAEECRQAPNSWPADGCSTHPLGFAGISTATGRRPPRDRGRQDDGGAGIPHVLAPERASGRHPGPRLPRVHHPVTPRP